MQIPSSLQDWQLLHAKVEDLFHISTTPAMQRIIWFVTISGPVSGFLYLISGWKRWKTNGSWIVRVDEEGYLHPHTHVAIPFWSFAFTCVNLAHSISLSIDLKYHIRARTVALNLLTYPVLSCFGWTKVWTLLYAMPPSMYRLAQVNQKIGSPTSQYMNRCLTPTSFNLIIITGYLLCLLAPIAPIILALKAAFELSSSWERYQSLYSQIIESILNQDGNLALELQALLLLKNMSRSLKQLQRNFKIMTIIFLVLTSVQLVATLWTSYHILSALYYQVIILRQAGKRLNHIRLELYKNDCSWSRTTEIDNSLKIASTPKIEFVNRSPVRSSDILKFKFGIRHFFPTFKRGTGVSAAMWKSGPFRKTKTQIVDGGVKQMMFYYRQLRRYAINTLWQTVITTAVITSYVVLMSVALGPTFRSVSDSELEVVVFAWINITWNCGTGLLLGVISCIVAFSPAPEVPREPEQQTPDEEF